MKVCLGYDHAGYLLLGPITETLDELGIEWEDLGPGAKAPVDYSDYAKKVCEAVTSKKADYGILICSTGIGMSIAANKTEGIRCALTSDCFSAEMTRRHNDTNVIALGASVIGPKLAQEMVKIFLTTPFSNEERHINRIRKADSSYK